MRFLILDLDYSQFIQDFYSNHPGLESRSYDEQTRARAESLFGLADFFSKNLRKLGHEAFDIYTNNRLLQSAWARENAGGNGKAPPLAQRALGTIRTAKRVAAHTPIRSLWKLVRQAERRSAAEQAQLCEILVAQVKRYKPDVLLNSAFHALEENLLRELKPHARLLVGQVAVSPSSGRDFGFYDLVISSMPSLVDHFRARGLRSELLRWAFEPSILDRLPPSDRSISVSFVGSFSPGHQIRLQWLEYLCSRLDVQVWGMGIEGLGKESSIRRSYRGQAWGLDMYRVFAKSKLTVNKHIDDAGTFANNMRLFEATGVGALLITDWKENLHEMFEPGKEVVAYRSPEECADLIRYYLDHDNEREAIARAGQARTLREHTYEQRVKELVDIIGRYL